MNKFLCMGTIIEIGKFKFILKSEIKYKSEIKIKIKLFDGNMINAVAYDKVADYILRNKLLNVTAILEGVLTCEAKGIYMNIYYIEKCKI